MSAALKSPEGKEKELDETSLAYFSWSDAFTIEHLLAVKHEDVEDAVTFGTLRC